MKSIKRNIKSISTSVYNAIKSLQDDFAAKAEISKKNSEIIFKQLLEPLNQLVKEQKDKLKMAIKTTTTAEKRFIEIKKRIEQCKNQYLTAHKTLDEGIALYEKAKEAEISPERKRKLSQKINQCLQNCKDTERKYTTQIYEGKNERIEYIKSLVY